MHDRSRGQALAEFALILPVFLIFVFAIIDLGRFVYTMNALSNGAREAARVGSVGSRPSECASLSRQGCIQLVADDRTWGIPGTVTTNVTCERVATNGSISVVATSTCRTGDLLVVQSETPFAPLTPILGQVLNVTVSGETRVTVNQ